MSLFFFFLQFSGAVVNAAATMGNGFDSGLGPFGVDSV